MCVIHEYLNSRFPTILSLLCRWSFGIGAGNDDIHVRSQYFELIQGFRRCWFSAGINQQGF